MSPTESLKILKKAQEEMSDAFDKIMRVVKANQKIFNSTQLYNLKNPLCLGAISQFLECGNGFESASDDNFMNISELKQIFEDQEDFEEDFEEEEELQRRDEKNGLYNHLEDSAN